MSTYPPYYAYPSAPPLVRALPKPPRLHWGWVLALNILTRGLFGLVWLIVQSYWVKRMRTGGSRAFVLSIVLAAFVPVFFLLAFALGAGMALTHKMGTDVATGLMRGLMIFWFFGFVGLYFAAVFTLRYELESEPIGVPLGGFMTFMFGTTYFQYHLHDYDVETPGGGVQPSGLSPGLGLSGATLAPIVTAGPPVSEPEPSV